MARFTEEDWARYQAERRGQEAAAVARPAPRRRTPKPRSVEPREEDTPQGSATTAPASGSLRITLPLPPKALSPNASAHYQERANARRTYRADCAWACAVAAREAGLFGARLPVPVVVELAFFCGRREIDIGYRPKDEDNAIASVKPALDALQDAGLIDSDARGNVRIGGCRIYGTEREHKGVAALVVTLGWGAGTPPVTAKNRAS